MPPDRRWLPEQSILGCAGSRCHFPRGHVVLHEENRGPRLRSIRLQNHAESGRVHGLGNILRRTNREAASVAIHDRCHDDRNAGRGRIGF